MSSTRASSARSSWRARGRAKRRSARRSRRRGARPIPCSRRSCSSPECGIASWDASRRRAGILGGDPAHVGLELEGVGDLRVAREHLRHTHDLHDASWTDAESPQLGEVKRRARRRPARHGDGEGQGLLETPREAMVGEGMPCGGPDLGGVGGIVRDEAKARRDRLALIEVAHLREEGTDLGGRAGFVDCFQAVERVGGHVEGVRNAHYLRRLVPERVAGHSLQLPGCSVSLDSVLARVDAAHHGGDHFLLTAGELAGAHRALHGAAVRGAELDVPGHDPAHGGRLHEVVVEPRAAQLEELLRGRRILGGGSEPDGWHGFLQKGRELRAHAPPAKGGNIVSTSPATRMCSGGTSWPLTTVMHDRSLGIFKDFTTWPTVVPAGRSRMTASPRAPAGRYLSRRAKSRTSTFIRPRRLAGGDDTQAFTRTEASTFVQVIQAQECRERHAVPLGDGAEGLAGLDHVDLGLAEVVTREDDPGTLEPSLDEALRGADGELEEIGSPWGRLPVVELRIELPKRVEAHPGENGNMGKSDALRYRCDLVAEWPGLRRRETVAFGFTADQRGGLDGRYIVLGLVAEDGPARELPEVVGAEHVDGPQDLHLPGVVGGLGQLPGPEHSVKVCEVPGGSHRGLFRVEPLVHPAVDAEAVAPGGGGHELPEALGSRSGDRDRVEAALDHRREHQVLGQTLRPEHALDHLGVAARPLYPPLDDGPTVASLEVLTEAADLGIVPNQEHSALRAECFRSGYV